MEARRRVRFNEGHDRGECQLRWVERRSGIATAPQKGKPFCVGFSFTLRDVLLIHDSESLSRPTTSSGSILSMGAAKWRIAPARQGRIFRILQVNFAEFLFHALG